MPFSKSPFHRSGIGSALFVVICVVHAVTCSKVTAEENEWIGKRFILKIDATSPSNQRLIRASAIPNPFTVRSVDGEWLMAGHARVRKSAVVPFSEGVAYYTELLRSNPESREAYHGRANVFHELSRFDEAIDDYNQALRLGFDDSKNYVGAALYLGRGNSWQAKGQIEKALSDYNASIRLDPAPSAALNSRATLWQRAGKIDNAIADYSRAISVDPLYVTAYLNRSTAWNAKGDPEKAAQDIMDAIRIDPSDARIYHIRAHLRHASGDFEQALTDYSEAIRLDPQNAMAYNARAWINATATEIRFRDGKRAVADATKSCELTRWESTEAIDTLAAAFAEAGQFDEAMKWQGRVILLTSKSRGNVESAKARLALYQAEKPFREAPPTGSPK